MATTTGTHERSSRRLSGESEFRRGWKPLSTAFVTYGLGPIIFLQTNALFVAPIREDTGLSASEVQTGSVVNLLTAISGVGVGMLINRFGSRRLVLGGFATMGGLAILLAVLPATPLVFYGVAALLGISGAMCYNVPFSRLIATWFQKNFGLAQGLMSAGASVMPLIATPIIVAVIYSFGWRAGYLLIAGLVLVIAVPVTFVGFREREPDTAATRPGTHGTTATAPEPVPATEGVPVGIALREPRLWLIFIGCAIATFAIGGFMSSLQPALLDHGWSAPLASAMSMVYLVGIILGRIAGGVLLDRLWPYAVPLIVCVMSGIAAFTLAGSIATAAVALLGFLVLLLGFAQGADADFPAFFSLRIAGQRAFPTVLGIVGLLTGLSTTAGGFVFAAIRDGQGSYVPAFRLGAIAYVVAGLLLFLVGLSSKKRAGQTSLQ
ncbi:MFS transporter [Streptomyces sp. NPDC002346]